MSKTDAAALRKKLGDLTEAIEAAMVAVEAATDPRKPKPKKAKAAQAELDALGAKRRKTWEKLEAAEPGKWTVEGWAIEPKPKKAKKKAKGDAIADGLERAGEVLASAVDEASAPATIEEAASAQRATLDAERADDVADTPEWKAAGERHLEHLAKIEELDTRRTDLRAYLADPSHKKKARRAAEESLAAIEAELEGLRKATAERANEVARVTTGRNLPKAEETDAEIRARVLAKRAAREAEAAGKALAETVETVPTINGRTEPEVEAWLDKEGEAPAELTKKKGKGKKAADPDAVAPREEVADKEAPGEDAPAIEDIEPVVRRDRWDRPIILTPSGEEKGYRRMTTFIDALEDKTTLTDWKQRVVVVGVAAIEQKAAGGDGIPEVMGIDEVGAESVLARVEASNIQFASAMKTLKKDLKKGRIDSKAYEEAAATVEKAQKAELNALVAEAFTAGDGFLKAEAGTRLHKLMELVDLGQPLPGDVTDLERRDIAAIQAAYEKLNVKIHDVERFVVRDDLEAAGTLDRRLSYDSPALGRRVIGIGDLKTGRMDFGAAKMARQLAGYAGGKGWNPAEPEKRENLRCNREVGLIFHIPAGSGICSVYELDLKTGDRGLKLCSEVYRYRAETSTLSKVTAQGDASPKAGQPIAVAEVAEVAPEVAA